ncbi:hypothetical protein [Pantoea agglomerans]|uniref:hypothetical protein n=1 Tax=Enterobacter agglomerans TaxID=549 RepID=UPI0012DAF818|nr:hypothetical protein [Pantoea agglomerans]
MKITADKLLAFYETKFAVYLFLIMGAIGSAVYFSHEFTPFGSFSFGYKLILFVPLMLILFVVTTIAGAALLWFVVMIITAVWRQTAGIHWALRVPAVLAIAFIWFLMAGGPGDF